MPEGPAILVGVGGGIAACKAPDVVSALHKRGAKVTALLSRNAHHFVAPEALKALSGREVGQDLFQEPASWGIGHISLAKEAKAFVIVAATADLLAKLACGIADDFVTTTALAWHPKPLILAPAMNTAMWRHPATQANLALLKQRGAIVLDPLSGRLACGDVGEGKLVDPLVIADEVWMFALGKASSGPSLRGSAGDAPSSSGQAFVATLKGKRVLISAGPTREFLDPVRFISNPSTGKMGYAIAEACRDLGAEVLLVSGPVSLTAPEGVTRIDVVTAQEMLEACAAGFDRCDAFVACAAVSDFRPAATAAQKKKKDGQGETLKLVANPDILLTLSKRKGGKVLVGFAAETEQLLAHGQAKL
ncbi:MAG TPA: bifunctional phosphopantothenoylcysteine decarboxylase/phosphopantothenate synthase, partial [bacterium]|nr:bifunctional phosphopantothenoylcysteine decarboxylase/phosphopantothenate synthase [bacterium]